MFYLFDMLVDWCSSLLAFLSKYQVKFAKVRLHNLRNYRAKLERQQQKLEVKVIDVQNEIDELSYFLQQDYKEV